MGEWKSIFEHPGESRKKWMIETFKKAGENTYHQFWQQDNQPKIVYTPDFAKQKLEYIHNNPGLLKIEFLI